MKSLMSFFVTVGTVIVTLSSPSARADVRCDSLFSNKIADVTVFATHLSPGTNRPWSPFRFRFELSFFTIEVLGNYAESEEGRARFPKALFFSARPERVSVNPVNRLVAVLGGDPGVYSFGDGVTPNHQGWRRIEQARARAANGESVFLVHEVPLTTSRPNFGFFKVYVTSGPELRELGSVIPRMTRVPGEATRVQYPNNVQSLRLISDTLVELSSMDGSTVNFEIEPPTPMSEQGLELRGFHR